MFLSRLRGLLLWTMVCGLAAPAAYSKAAPALRTRSHLEGVSLVALGALPHSPENGSLDDYCEGYRAKTLTPTGALVAKLGWIVTSEAPLGRYEVVSFASGFDASTSAICLARNANIAVFDGSTLIALAYASRSARSPLGVVEPLESGALLVWSDTPGAPVGELREASGGLILTAIAPERTFCGRRAVVPNVYGKRIEVARRILMTHGWRPRRPRERPIQLAADLAGRGVIEAEACSGTGVGYCAFNYRGPAGLLSVTTTGDDPTVESYAVVCRAQ